VASVSYSLDSTVEAENEVGPKDEEEFRKLLGNATWRLLHTLAARYPDEPTDVDKTRMDQFIGILSHIYPCPKCARHMKQMFAANPPKVNHPLVVDSLVEFPGRVFAIPLQYS
jgi:hypothetical protein